MAWARADASPTDGITSSSPPSERAATRMSPRITAVVRASHRWRRLARPRDGGLVPAGPADRGPAGGAQPAGPPGAGPVSPRYGPAGNGDVGALSPEDP